MSHPGVPATPRDQRGCPGTGDYRFPTLTLTGFFFLYTSVAMVLALVLYGVLASMMMLTQTLHSAMLDSRLALFRLLAFPSRALFYRFA